MPAFVELTGELDLYAAEQTGETLEEYLMYAGDLVIDVSRLSFIDGAGLRLLRHLFAEAAVVDTQVTLHDPSPILQRLIQVSGVGDRVATCTADQEAVLVPLAAVTRAHAAAPERARRGDHAFGKHAAPAGAAAAS